MVRLVSLSIALFLLAINTSYFLYLFIFYIIYRGLWKLMSVSEWRLYFIAIMPIPYFISIHNLLESIYMEY